MAPAGRGRPALRALARRRELRHGAHGGVRLRHAGGGLGHRRLPRRGARRRRRRAGARPATPSSSGEALRALALDPARRERMAGAARERAERFAWPRVAARGRPRSTRRPLAHRARGRGRARGRARPARARPSPARACGPRRLPSLEPRTPAARRRARGPHGAARARWRPAPWPASGLTVLALQRLGIESIGQRAPRRHAGLGAGRLRADVRLDARARRGLARDPARRAARHRACAAATPRAPR